MVAAVLVELERHDGHPGQERGALLRHSAPQHQPTDPCTCIRDGHDQGVCKLTVRAGLPGATIRALVPRAPNVDLCPGRLATTDAQSEVAPARRQYRFRQVS